MNQSEFHDYVTSMFEQISQLRRNGYYTFLHKIDDEKMPRYHINLKRKHGDVTTYVVYLLGDEVKMNRL